PAPGERQSQPARQRRTDFARGFRMKLFFAATLIAAGALLSSCGSTGRVGANSGGRPSVLRYAASSAQEDPATASPRQEYMRSYLERQLNMPVQIVQT